MAIRMLPAAEQHRQRYQTGRQTSIEYNCVKSIIAAASSDVIVPANIPCVASRTAAPAHGTGPEVEHHDRGTATQDHRDARRRRLLLLGRMGSPPYGGDER